MDAYWNRVFESNEIEKLGWYEYYPEKCLYLLDKCSLNKDDIIIDIGSGVSNLIDNLLARGYENLVALDISNSAIKIKKKLLKENGLDPESITWITGDIKDNSILQERLTGKIMLWHDRAVLHFLREQEERNLYLENLLNNLSSNGYVIIAAFSKNGAKRCSGLDLLNYDVEDIEDFLGDDFKLLSSFSYTYYQPSGNPRPFIYSLFQRIS